MILMPPRSNSQPPGRATEGLQDESTGQRSRAVNVPRRANVHARDAVAGINAGRVQTEPAGQAAAPGVRRGPLMKGTAPPSRAEPTDRAALVRFLAAIPRDDTARLSAGGAGYCLGLIDGRAEVHAQIGHAGEEVCTAPEWKDVVRQPTDHELTRRRGENLPCRVKCGTCMQCLRSKRWWAHHWGVDRER